MNVTFKTALSLSANTDSENETWGWQAEQLSRAPDMLMAKGRKVGVQGPLKKMALITILKSEGETEIDKP